MKNLKFFFQFLHFVLKKIVSLHPSYKIAFYMIFVLRKLGTFDTNKILTLAVMRADLFVSMGLLIPLNADKLCSLFLFTNK